MAFSAVFFPSCVPQTQNSLLSIPKPHSLSPVTSLLPPQATQKFLYQASRYKRISPIGVNRGRSIGKVKALKEEEKSYKSVEVFSEEHLLVSLAHDVNELSKKFIKERGAFSVVLTDGSSVKYLRKLVEPPIIDTIEWSKWQFFWVEEQVLVPGDQLKKRLKPNDQLVAKINHKVTYNEFLSKVPLREHELNVYTSEYDLSAEEEAGERYEKKLQIWVTQNVIAKSRKDQLPKFDLMLLDMDSDGRMGSLAPEHPVLSEKEKWVSAVKEKDTTRVTLTLPVINSSSNIAMVVAGSTKADAVYSALKDDDQQAHRKLPAKLVSPDEGELIWYLDKGAASKLFKEEVHMEKCS